MILRIYLPILEIYNMNDLKIKERYNYILKKSFQEYIDWWLPIDIESGSLASPMSY